MLDGGLLVGFSELLLVLRERLLKRLVELLRILLLAYLHLGELVPRLP